MEIHVRQLSMTSYEPRLSTQFACCLSAKTLISTQTNARKYYSTLTSFYGLLKTRYTPNLRVLGRSHQTITFRIAHQSTTHCAWMRLIATDVCCTDGSVVCVSVSVMDTEQNGCVSPRNHGPDSLPNGNGNFWEDHCEVQGLCKCRGPAAMRFLLNYLGRLLC